MATLQRNKNDDHFFIRVSPSEGTKQIIDEGVNWLLKQGYRLSPGGKVSLPTSDYRYLDDKGYLYIEGIFYDKQETSERTLFDDDIEREGPSLLLKLNKDHDPSKGIDVPWTLIIKLDELEEQAQRELNHKGATAITIGSPTSPYRIPDLRGLQDANRWPKVSPQLTPYNIYYRNSQNQIFQLTKSIPTQGLQGGWRGNIFLRFEHPQLANTWRRSRVDEQISIDTGKEFYWIAQSGQDPEEWPGTYQSIGPVNQDWQLWHLQTETLDDSWEAIQQWLRYRQIRLTYPTWHLRIINPFHVVKDHHYVYSSEQKLLLQCDPPDQQSGNTPAHTALSLIPLQNSFPRKQVPVSFQSNVFQHNQSNYFYTPTLTIGQEYRIRLQGEATGSAISTHISPLSTTHPSWLRGLSCTLLGSNAQYTFCAFSNIPEAMQSFNLRVPKDFSLEDLSKLAWKLEPTEIPCSLTWDYSALPGEPHHSPTTISLSENNLNSWWQMKIWPAIADRSWARITVDAGSFGKIVLRLDLKPERVVDDLWWRDEQLSALFIWLSNTGEKDQALHKNPVLPTLRDTLLQLGRSHDLPPALANAFIRLAMRSHIPAWMQARLQIVVSKIQHKRLFAQAIEQKR